MDDREVEGEQAEVQDSTVSGKPAKKEDGESEIADFAHPDCPEPTAPASEQADSDRQPAKKCTKKKKKLHRSKLCKLRRLGSKVDQPHRELAPEEAPTKRKRSPKSSVLSHSAGSAEHKAKGKSQTVKAQKSKKDQKSQRTAPKRSRSKKTVPPPCPKITDLVTQTLSQCVNSDCTHPKWKLSKMDQEMFQISVYWSRRAVGVKVANTCLPKVGKVGKKGKGKGKRGAAKWSQVAYFGGKTPCVYTNMVVAEEFATLTQLMFQ